MKDGESIVRNMTLEQLCQIVGIQQPEGFPGSMKFSDVLGSSIAAKKDSAVFVWKTGEKDSCYQVNDAIEKKAGMIFCAQRIKDKFFPDEKIVVGVERPATCITKYIYFARHCFDAKVIAVTGSLGKTTTTSMIKNVLIGGGINLHCGGTIDNSKGAIIRLTQQLKNEHDAYLQEVGAAEPGHVESLAQGLCPDIAVITNVTDPHLDKYKTRENILKDKASLVEHLTENGVAFFDMDNDLLRNYQSDKKIIYYAIDHKEADYYAENIVQNDKGQTFDIVCRASGERYSASLNALGVHNTRNALAAFAVGRHMGLSTENIIKSLASYEPEGQRQNLTTIGGYRVLLDMFNSAPESVIGAIKIMEDIKLEEGGRRILIIGDMARLGDASKELHKRVGAEMAECTFDYLYCFGEDIKYAYEEAVKARGSDCVFYTNDREKLNDWIRTNVTRKDVTLYKASQTVALAKTVDAVYGTTYYHGLQGVFVSYEEDTNDGVALQYRHVGDYLECSKPMSKSVKTVRIKDILKDVPVRRITQNAFTECRELCEIFIPDTVVNIGRRAFYICPKLTKIHLPKHLLMIESSAFNYCRHLEEIVIPEGTVSVGSRAFYDCKQLKSVQLPASVGYIGSEAFANCPHVVVKVPEDSYAKAYCEKNGVRFECISVDENKKKYKLSDVTFEKAPNDYRYKVKRTAPEDSSRYVKDGDVWRKKKHTVTNEAVLMCAGDLMCEPVLSEAAYCDGKYYFQPMLKYVRGFMKQADFSIANLETLVTENLPYAHEMHVIKHHTGPRYHCNAPLDYLDALRFAGFDAFVLANNHAADGGYEGIIDTIDNLDDRDFMRTGMFRDEKDPRVLVVDINGIKVGILAYTEHVNRKLDRETLTKEGCDTLLNHFEEEKVKRDIALARAQGAEFMLCYIHYLGKDYSHEIVKKNIKTAEFLANAGFDCVMGSHMHAVQGYDIIETADHRKVPTIYSLGNFISSDSNPLAKESVVYRLVLKKDESGVHIKDESYIPFWSVEGAQRSWYSVLPLPKRYRKASEEMDEREADIAKWMGDKIKEFE